MQKLNTSKKKPITHKTLWEQNAPLITLQIT